MKDLNIKIICWNVIIRQQNSFNSRRNVLIIIYYCYTNHVLYPFLSFLSLFSSYHKKFQKARRIDGLSLEILKGKKHFCFVKSAHWPFKPKKSRCFRYFLHFPYDFLTAKYYPVNCSRFTYSCFICIEECTYRFKVILASACPSNSLSVFASNPWAIQSVA